MRSSPSARRSRASPPDWPSRRCSSGRARRSPPRSRPTCSPRRCAGGGSSARCSCSTRSGSPGVDARHLVAARRRRTWDGALEVAWRLAAAGELDQRGVEGGDFWAVAAEQRLAPLLFAAARTGGGIEAVVRWAYGQGGRELDEALARITGEATDEQRAERRPRRLRRRPGVRGPGRPHANLDRGHRPGAAAGLPLQPRASRSARTSRDHAPTGCSTSAATLYLIGDAKASKLLRPIFLALLSRDRRPRLRARDARRRPAGAAAAALPRRGRQRGPAARTWPRSPRPPRATTSSSSRSSTTSPRPAAATAARPRRWSTATGRGCCCPASPTSRRCATSPGWSARRRRGTGPGRPAPAGTTRSTGRRRRPLVAAEAAPAAPDRARAAALRPDRRRCCCGCGCGSPIGGCGRWRGRLA